MLGPSMDTSLLGVLSGEKAAVESALSDVFTETGPVTLLQNFRAADRMGTVTLAVDYHPGYNRYLAYLRVLAPGDRVADPEADNRFFTVTGNSPNEVLFNLGILLSETIHGYLRHIPALIAGEPTEADLMEASLVAAEESEEDVPQEMVDQLADAFGAVLGESCEDALDPFEVEDAEPPRVETLVYCPGKLILNGAACLTFIVSKCRVVYAGTAHRVIESTITAKAEDGSDIEYARFYTNHGDRVTAIGIYETITTLKGAYACYRKLCANPALPLLFEQHVPK